MKILKGFLAAIVVCLLIKYLNESILKIRIPDFLSGWVCCMAYYIISILHEENNKTN